MRDQLTDEMLTQAAKQVAESMKASLPVPKECHHEFPPEFERDMKRLAAQTERRRHMRRYLQRVAAACLAVVISLSTWLAVDAEARAAFVQWVKTVYEQSVVYEFFIQVRRRMKLVTCSVGCQMVTPWKTRWVEKSLPRSFISTEKMLSTLLTNRQRMALRPSYSLMMRVRSL